MTRQVRAAALALGGEAEWEALLASLSPACRTRFSNAIGYYDWVESGLALELHEAWARLRGQDDMVHRGEDAARQILGGVQRWILKLASPGFVLENAPRVFGFYYRGGQMNLVRLGPGEAEIHFRAAGYPETWFEDGLTSALKVALELAGARGTVVHHAPPDPESPEPWLHRYGILWQK
jgi:hypothetical protein